MIEFALNLCSPVTNLKALTPEGVSRITGLAFRRAEQISDLPEAPGAYLWAADWTGPCLYFGAAAGTRGLRHRVGNEFRWQAQYRQVLDRYDPLESEAVTEVPLVRIAAELHLRCYVAEAIPAVWNVDDASLQVPATALEWERFIQEASAVVTGHRGVIGGGAWESKAGSLGDRMQAVAIARLRDLRAG